jgi:hypothetical protein
MVGDRQLGCGVAAGMWKQHNGYGASSPKSMSSSAVDIGAFERVYAAAESGCQDGACRLHACRVHACMREMPTG